MERLALSQATRNAIRAAIAVAIALLITRLLHLRFPYWLIMVTIILMQTNIGASIAKSSQRILGTIFGLLAGVMLTLLFNKQIYFLYIALPVLILLYIYTIPFAYKLATFALSMLLGIMFTYVFPEPWAFIFWRIIDTFVGAGISVFSLMVLFPAWARNNFKTSLSAGIESCQKLLEEFIESLLYEKEDVSDFMAQIIEIGNLLVKRRQHLADYIHEPGKFAEKEVAYAIIISQERMHSLLLSLHIIRNDLFKNKLGDNLKNILNEFGKRTRKIANEVVQLIKKHNKSPDFSKLNESLLALENIAKIQKNCVPLLLLCRNLAAYVSELKHITITVRPVKNMAK